MKHSDRWRLLPHEIIFGIFVVATMARLIWVQGPIAPLPLLFAGMLGVMIGGVAWCRANESAVRWRVRLGIYPMLICVTYFTLRSAVPVFDPLKVDALLQSFDTRVVGGNVSLWMERISHPVFTEILSACYIAFFPFVLLAWVHYFKRELPVLRRFIIGLFTVYGIGYLGYSLTPAVGPHLDPAMASQFRGALEGGWITHINNYLVVNGSNRVDAFPSLHCAVTAFVLLFDRVHAPRRFRFWVLPVIGLWIATVYLRYHYFVDVVAGLALAGAVYVMVRQTRAATSTHQLYSPLGEQSGSRSS